MKERPIIFNASEVRACLDGRKTQHRVPMVLPGSDRGPLYRPTEKAHGLWSDSHCMPFRCPYGVPGDRLWVKEGFYFSRIEREMDQKVWYRADNDRPTWAERRWRSPVVMPRWASRITLEVVSIRVEQVQEISEEDARAEGCPHGGRGDLNSYGAEILATRVEWFRRCWDSRYAKRGFGWDANPWVWVRELRRVER